MQRKRKKNGTREKHIKAVKAQPDERVNCIAT
jgi:hypothetical protein